MSNFPSVRPSLNLQFDSQPTPEDMTSHLASVGATFSRASIGTYTDANGIIQEATSGQARPNYSSAGVHEGLLIEESRTNLVKSSEDFSTNFWTISAGGTGSVPIVTVNQGIAPDGTATADRIQFDLNGGSTSSDVSTISPSSSISVTNGDFIISVYLKSYDGSSYDVALGSNAADTNLDKITVTNEWQRFDVLHNATASATNFYFGLRNAGGLSGLSDTADILIWGAQVEAGSFPTSYIPTIPTFSSRASTATYFDSSGVLQTASIDEARTDHKYIDGQWVEAGLLLEGASTNLVLNSNTSDWSAVRSTRGSATTFATNINGFLYSATSTSPNINENFGTASTGDYVFSIYVDATNSNKFDIHFVVDGSADKGVNATFTPSTESFGSITENTSFVTSGSGKVGFEKIDTDIYRLYISANFTAGSTWFPIVYFENNATNVAMGGAQIEAGSQPTSYIATTGSTATRSADVYTTATKERSADVCYIDGTAFTDFYNDDAGTILSEFYYNGLETSGNAKLFYFNDGTGNNVIFSDMPENQLVLIKNEVTQVNLNGTDIVADSNNKSVSAFQVNDAVLFTNGSQVGTDTSLEMPTVSQLNIGSTYADTSYLNGSIKKLIYFPRRLSDNELIKLTQ